MGNLLNGFTVGLMLGTGLFSTFSALQRRGQQQKLESLLQSGAYRVLKANGGDASAGELLAALGGEPTGRLSKSKMLALSAFFATAGIAAAVVLATR